MDGCCGLRRRRMEDQHRNDRRVPTGPHHSGPSRTQPSRRSPEDMTRAQFGWWAGLVTCISGALIGQAELIMEPWRHYVTIAFVVGTAVSGYMIQRPPTNGNGRPK